MGMAFTVVPSGSPSGATLNGIDLRADLDAGTVGAVRAAWSEHQVVAFPNQDLTLEEFEQVALRFGAFGVDPYFQTLDAHPHVAEVKRDADETTKIFAEAWHSDWSFLAQPPSATLLLSRVIPPHGGDTLYANQYAAYDALDTATQRQLESLQGIHSARRGYAPTGAYGTSDVGRSMAIITSDSAMATQLHPLVRTHPETGRKSLFLSIGYTIGIEGMEPDAAQQLLMELHTHQCKPEFLYRHVWEPNMLVMWDNRCLLHAATGGYDGYARLLHRITVV
jgi:taurine dioxygenase